MPAASPAARRLAPDIAKHFLIAMATGPLSAGREFLKPEKVCTKKSWITSEKRSPTRHKTFTEIRACSDQAKNRC
jgi:hypothetical protein